jgi:predicted RNA-binding protein YlxR (DUF448 family)
VATGEAETKKGPVRTCVGCRRKALAAELFRVVLEPGGVVVGGNRRPGRGAWLCAAEGGPSEDCLTRAIRTGALARALRADRKELRWQAAED